MQIRRDAVVELVQLDDTMWLGRITTTRHGIGRHPIGVDDVFFDVDDVEL